MANRAVFLDRDGTLIEEVNYLSRVEDMIVFPFAAEAVRTLRCAGFLVVVITNQSAIARGLVSEEKLAQIHQALDEQLRDQDARIDAYYYCPHHEEGSVEQYKRTCGCRKPAPGMLVQAATQWDIDLQASCVVGDRVGDIAAGHRAGCRSILVKTGYGSQTVDYLAGLTRTEDNEELFPDWVCENLQRAADRIIAIHPDS